MSVDPQVPVPQPEELLATPAPPGYRWYHLFGAFAFILFCMAVGAYLLWIPWTKDWNQNLFSSLRPEWHQYWENSYVRGAVSGLGVVNIYISFLEALRLRRFARR